MRVKFEMSINPETGEPIIKMSHFYSDKSLPQIVLGLFIEMAKQKGITIHNTGGVMIGPVSRNDYEIRINNINIVANDERSR